MKSLGIKHLISCHCTLKIFEKNNEIQDHLYHKFPVYSQIDHKTGKIIERLAMCNNCNTTHRIFDYCKSELVSNPKEKENMSLNIDDIKIQLSDKIVKIMEKYNPDLATWEHVLDVFDKEAWGSNIIISRDLIDQMYHVKILSIVDENKIKILTKIIKDEIEI
jgi:hypothetical protein